VDKMMSVSGLPILVMGMVSLAGLGSKELKLASNG